MERISHLTLLPTEYALDIYPLVRVVPPIIIASEQLISETNKYSVPQILLTERPDKVTKYLYEGRVAVIVNGNPYVHMTFSDGNKQVVIQFFYKTSFDKDTLINA